MSRIFRIIKNQSYDRTYINLTRPKSSLCVFFTDASKYAWACVLTQEKAHQIEEKEVKILHPITYMSGLFQGSQMNWACLTKEA